MKEQLTVQATLARLVDEVYLLLLDGRPIGIMWEELPLGQEG